MKLSKTLGQQFRDVCQEQADEVAIYSEADNLTFSQVHAIVEAFTLQFQRHGVSQDSVVIVDANDILVSLAGCLAASYIGASFAFSGERLRADRTVNKTHLFAMGPSEAMLQAGCIAIDENWSPHLAFSKGRLDFDTLPEVDTSLPWMITTTSGSTGTAKILALSQDVVSTRCRSYSVDFKPRETVLASLFSASSRPFLQRALACLINGGSLVEGQQIDFWRRSRVTVVVASPLQAIDYMRDFPKGHKFPALQAGGAKLKPGTIAELLEHFEVVYNAYGSSETGRAFLNKFSHDENGGVACEGVDIGSSIEIVDDLGKAVEMGEIGLVRIRNAQMADGYIGNPIASAAVFRNGWFYSGDKAKWGPSKELDVQGRDDDVINLGGIKIDANEVEFFIRAQDGVEEAVVFANPRKTVDPRLVAFVRLKPLTHQDDVLLKVAKACTAKFTGYRRPEKFFPVDKLPMTESGKISRKMCEQMVLDKFDEA